MKYYCRDAYSEEPTYTNKPLYQQSCEGYGGDAHSEEPSYANSQSAGPSPHPPSPMKLTRLPRSVLSSSAVLSREIKMFFIATAALLVFETTTEAATMMYDYRQC